MKVYLIILYYETIIIDLYKILSAGDDPNSRVRSLNSQTVRNYSLINQRLFQHAFYELEPITVRSYSTETSNKESKPTLFQKMKQMTKDYWHILIPVHVATSIVWISIFYIAVKKYVEQFYCVLMNIIKYYNKIFFINFQWRGYRRNFEIF